MDKYPKITVTVPVYNTSKSLNQCLDSLVNQTLEGIEIIIVDDGSNDDSGAICDDYAAKHQNFKVIHQQNGGLAAARQAALAAAKGEYVIVCDSDDWVEPDMYEKLYQEAKRTDADIVSCGYYAEYPDGRSVPMVYRFSHLEGEAFKKEVLLSGFHMSWNKLIKRSLLEGCQDGCYVKGINLGEDAFMLMRILKDKSVSVAQIDDKLYHYRRVLGGNSYTNSIRATHVDQNRTIYQWLKINYDNQEYHQIITSKAINLAFTMLRAQGIEKSEFNKFVKSELPFSKLVTAPKTPKTLLVIFSKMLPFKISKYILRSFYPLFYK